MTDKKIILNLHKIFYKLGPLGKDSIEHAINIINSNSRLAKECLELMGVEIKPINDIYGAE